MISSLQMPDLTMLDLMALGKSLIVLGLAFFVSGLVFLLPSRREQGLAEPSHAEKVECADHHLDQMRLDSNNREWSLNKAGQREV